MIIIFKMFSQRQVNLIRKRLLEKGSQSDIKKKVFTSKSCTNFADRFTKLIFTFSSNSLPTFPTLHSLTAKGIGHSIANHWGNFDHTIPNQQITFFPFFFFLLFSNAFWYLYRRKISFEKFFTG